jgi:hypothetical protein
MLKLYDQFAKFSKSEIQHFHKLEQQRKVAKLDEASRPCHNDKQQNYPKPVHNIDSDGHEPPKNWQRATEGLCRKECQSLLTKDPPSTTSGAEL